MDKLNYSKTLAELAGKWAFKGYVGVFKDNECIGEFESPYKAGLAIKPSLYNDKTLEVSIKILSTEPNQGFVKDLTMACESWFVYPKKPEMVEYNSKLHTEAIKLQTEPWQKDFVLEPEKILTDKQIGQVFLLEDQKRILGLIVLICDKKNNVYDIDSLMIDKRFQGRGYGTFMVSWAIDYLKKLGAEHLEVGVKKANLVAQNLYQKLGFEVTKAYSNTIIMSLDFDKKENE